MKKGFTLIEVLGVIVILSIIALITVPMIGKYIKQAKNDSYDNQVSFIKLATQNWVSDHKNQFSDTTLSNKVFLSQLINDDYLEKTVYQTYSTCTISAQSYVLVTKKTKSFTYQFVCK